MAWQGELVSRDPLPSLIFVGQEEGPRMLWEYRVHSLLQALDGSAISPF